MCHTTLLYVCIIKKRKSSLLVLLTQNKSFFLWGKERHPPLTRRFVFSGHFFLFFPFNFASFFPPCLSFVWPLASQQKKGNWSSREKSSARTSTASLLCEYPFARVCAQVAHETISSFAASVDIHLYGCKCR